MKTTIYRLAATLVLAFGMMAPAYMQDTCTLTILQTSDTHSRIDPIEAASNDKYAGMGGVLRRATMLEELRKEIPDLLLFDCGDISQGTPYYNFYQGEVEVKVMNAMHYDVGTIGNHEFDFGMDNLARLIRMAEFPVICSNYDFGNSVLAPLVKPYIVLQRKGLKIGVFALGPKLEGLVPADKCEGVTYQDPVTVTNKVATLLKKVEKCDVVICLSHLGVSDDEPLIRNTRNVDFVFGGHSHTFMKKPVTFTNLDGKSISLFHTGKSGIFVGRTDLIFRKK